MNVRDEMLNMTGVIEEGVLAAGLKQGDKLLDIGCGEGGTLSMLQDRFGLSVVGVDAHEEMVRRAKNRNEGLDVRQGAAESLEFDSCSFDAALMECTFSLFDRQDEAMMEAMRVLKPGGNLILTDLCRRPQRLSDNYEREDALFGRGRTGDIPHVGEFIKAWEEQGFCSILFMDKTKELDEYFVEKVWEHGSIDAYLDHVTPEGVGREHVCKFDIAGEKPGYFLMIMEKPE